jgi:hypothetical protein
MLGKLPATSSEKNPKLSTFSQRFVEVHELTSAEQELKNIL